MSNEHSDPEFQQRIDKGEYVEPRDYMPQGYRKHLIQQISQPEAQLIKVRSLPDGTH